MYLVTWINFGLQCAEYVDSFNESHFKEGVGMVVYDLANGKMMTNTLGWGLIDGFKGGPQ